MQLCLDVGNSHIFGGIFNDDKISLRFRHATALHNTSDELGIFLKAVIKENGCDIKKIKDIAISSVVPSLDYSLRSACIKYFNINPLFISSEIKTNLTIKIDQPSELGADLIADAVAATQLFPKKNIIIISMGTATTFSAINKKQEYLGVAILPGMRLSMEALQGNTAKLFAVEIMKPPSVLGKNTTASIQSGLYFGQLGVFREITQRITEEYFKDDAPVIIGCGGFSHLFEQEHIFTELMPDLILLGLKHILDLNRGPQK
ncbi:MAG TPA: type III pantothenate kinase [Gammaproteobacteria bacterium]|nr:type III pantothenate kinase [Gammaproteobacteria bacterium]